MALTDAPSSLKATSIFLKCAAEHDTRDPVIAYYCRLCAFQKGLSMDSSSQEARSFLNKLITNLEASKKQLSTNECISSESVGLAHLEAYALKLFQFAYQRDSAGDFGKATVKSFFTAGVLLDVANILGDKNEELEKARKYAKWKAIYINQCQKNGETPVPGPAAADEPDQLPAIDSSLLPAAQPAPQQPSSSSVSQPPVRPVQPQQNDVDETVEAACEDQDDADDILPLETYATAEKYARFAMSALQHQDKNTAIENLLKALKTLRS